MRWISRGYFLDTKCHRRREALLLGLLPNFINSDSNRRCLSIYRYAHGHEVDFGKFEYYVNKQKVNKHVNDSLRQNQVDFRPAPVRHLLDMGKMLERRKASAPGTLVNTMTSLRLCPFELVARPPFSNFLKAAVLEFHARLYRKFCSGSDHLKRLKRYADAPSKKTSAFIRSGPRRLGVVQ